MSNKNIKYNKMKKNLLLSLGVVLLTTMASAQSVHLDIAQKDCKFVNDSLIVEMSLSGEISDLNSRNAILLTPFLSAPDQSVDLTPIQLNGKYKQILHARNAEMRSRMKSSELKSDQYVQGLGSNGKFSLNYRVSVAKADWMNELALQIRCENIDADNELVEISNIYVQRIDESTSVASVNSTPQSVAVAKVESTPTPTSVSTPTSTAVSTPASTSAPVAKSESPTTVERYRGSYVAPDSDATDVRNQRDLNFSLEEAQVMVNVNPQILSLKELFTVAMSYKEDRDKFYHIISTCVKLYPTHPIANLNAASMAIELDDAVAANKYLQIAPYESLAYKNCRGAYELMNGNIYEGIRLLKSAKAEGSEEAGYNLDLFFKRNK